MSEVCSSENSKYISEENKLTTFRFVVLGPPGDIKSRLTETLMLQKHLPNSYLYIANSADSNRVIMSWKGTSYLISIRDTTGQENYDALRFLNYEGADVFLVAFAADPSRLQWQFETAEAEWAMQTYYCRPGGLIILLAVHTFQETELESREYYNFESSTSRFNRADLRDSEAASQFQQMECSLDDVSSVNDIFAKVCIYKIIIINCR